MVEVDRESSRVIYPFAILFESLSDQQPEVRSEVVLPSALVMKVQKIVGNSNPPQTVSEFVEKAVRASIATEEAKERSESTEDDSEVIKNRLKALGYL